MKILLVAPVPPPYGGIANWVLLMEEYFKDNRENELVGIIDISPKKRGLDGRTLWDRIVKQGFEMFKLNSKLKQMIQDKNPNILHMTTSGQFAIIRDILFLYTAKIKKIPTLYHIRFGRIPEIEKKNTLEWKLLKKAIKLSNKVITIDEKTYQVLNKHFCNNKIEKIANPFNLNKITLIKNKNPSKVIMFLGWCIKEKGIEELLLAWEEINRDYPEWNLKLVGPINDNYKMELLKKFSMKQVILEGEKEHDVALELLNNSSIFILPSYTEGFPNSILEAMALEKPIIATDVGAIAEMLEQDGGIIIPPKDKNAIKESLIKLLDDKVLRELYGNNAKERLVNNYSIEVIVKKYNFVWREIQSNENL